MTMRAIAILMVLVLAGCASDKLSGYVDKAKADFRDMVRERAAEVVPSEPAEVEEETVDALDLSLVRWLGSNYAGAHVTATLLGASMDNIWLHTQYEDYSWPEKSVGGANVDAICCLFYERDGKVVGGKFDWWWHGGQALKGLENVRSGYNGHVFPVEGARVWTMIVSVDGKQRSNVVAVGR